MIAAEPGQSTSPESGYFFPGSVGAVKIYDRALTQQEISQNFEALRDRYNL